METAILAVAILVLSWSVAALTFDNRKQRNANSSLTEANSELAHFADHWKKEFERSESDLAELLKQKQIFQSVA